MGKYAEPDTQPFVDIYDQQQSREQLKALCEARLIDANTASKLAGYAFRSGFKRAVDAGVMPEPILRFPGINLWDAEEIKACKRAA